MTDLLLQPTGDPDDYEVMADGQAEAQQQPAQANAAIEAEEESRNRAPPLHRYLDPAALSSGTNSGPEPWGVVPLPRRPASPRR